MINLFFINLFFRAAAVLLIGSLFASATQAKAPIIHNKKASHKKVAQKTDASDPSQWKSDAKLLSLLQPERQFGSFSMRIPVGFTVEQHDMSSGNHRITGYLVKGPLRSDGTATAIFIVTSIAPPGYETDAADALLNGNAALNGKANITKSAIEDGEANGLELSRQYYKYPAAPGATRLVHGFHYATTDGHTDALVAALDAEPYNATSLPLAEAAALTLRRTN